AIPALPNPAERFTRHQWPARHGRGYRTDPVQASRRAAPKPWWRVSHDRARASISRACGRSILPASEARAQFQAIKSAGAGGGEAAAELDRGDHFVGVFAVERVGRERRDLPAVRLQT